MPTLTKTSPKKAAATNGKARSAQDYKVKDMSLADWGRKEISVAEAEMPGLMSLRQKHGSEKPLNGGRVTGSLHMTIETAGRIETLAGLGASGRSGRWNNFNPQEHAPPGSAKNRVAPFAPQGASRVG